MVIEKFMMLLNYDKKLILNICIALMRRVFKNQFEYLCFVVGDDCDELIKIKYIYEDNYLCNEEYRRA